MRKLLLSCAVVLGELILLSGCEIETGDSRVTQTSSARKAFQYVEDDLQSITQLFENILRLDQEIQRRGIGTDSSYFSGETIFHDQEGWYGVTDWNGCRFKMYPLNGKSLPAEGAKWIAVSRYYSNDSLYVESLGTGQWLVEGFTKGSSNWRTEVSCQISLAEGNVTGNLDSVALLLQGTGVTLLSENYPASDVKITFSTPKPLLRKNKTEYRFYPFMEGNVQIQLSDLRQDRKEQAFVEIDHLPLGERMVRITSRGVTEIY